MKKMKKLGKVFSSLLIGLTAFALSVSPAYAAAVARNVNIYYSDAYVEATEDVEIIIDDFNWAEDVGWWIDTEANTGDNNSSGGGLIDTDPAGVFTDVETGVNSNSLMGWVDLGGQTLAENNTIDNSGVEAVASKTSYLGVETFNGAFWVGSIITGLANSGENTAEGGLLGGSGGEIYTGPAGFGAISDTVANTNSLWASIDMSGSTTARNYDVTNSAAEANASSEVGVGVYTTNWAVLVGNVVSGEVNSGSNEASGGNGWDGGNGGYIDTGLALFGSDTSTSVNSNETVLAVDLGGATLATNIGIDSSYAEANAESLAGVTVVNENGAFLVGNIVGGYANSGENTANGGDAGLGFGGNGGVIYTGEAGAVAFADTLANSNSTTVAGSIGGSTTARNSGVDSPLWWNGTYADADSEAGVLVVNDNGAIGGNLISVEVNSGWNEASGGEGDTGGNGGLIVTGDAGVIVGSSVSMNDNYTWVAGDFGGNSTAENLGIDSSYAYAGANQDSDTGTFVEVRNLNDVFAANLVNVYANTGGNGADGGENGGNGGEIYAGDALLLAGADTVVNTSETYVVGDFTGNAAAANSGISNSEVEAYADTYSEVVAVNDNEANVSTSVIASVNTGENQANGNSDGGEIYTGEAFLVTDVGTTVNSSTTTVVGAGGGNATASNTAVSGSLATAAVSSTGSTTVVNTNSADIETSVETAANTGGNDASGSSSGGTIVTGDAVNGTQVSTTVNTNDTTVVMEQGNASASNTGVSGSSATATADSSTSTTVTNTNDADVVNNVSTSSNTGGNTAVDGGTVSTGGAGTSTTGSTTTNTNTTTLVVTY